MYDGCKQDLYIYILYIHIYDTVQMYVCIYTIMARIRIQSYSSEGCYVGPCKAKVPSSTTQATVLLALIPTRISYRIAACPFSTFHSDFPRLDQVSGEIKLP